MAPELLISIHHGFYDSPHPVAYRRAAAGAEEAFLAPPTTTSVAFNGFTNDNCGHPFHIPLTEAVGSGATGVLYSGYAHPIDTATTRSNITPLPNKLAFKIAVDEEQCVHLRHEANAYVRMQNAGVKGIPRFYGLFEESQTPAGAFASLGMLISFVEGRSLASLGDQGSVSATPRYILPLPDLSNIADIRTPC